MSVPVIAPPAPVTPLPAQGAKGEMRLTPTGVVAWDGQQWIDADLFAAIVDDPANFNHVNVATSVKTPVVQLATGDANEVVPGQLAQGVSGSGGTRQPLLGIAPPIFSEADQSILAAALQLFGTSPDGTVPPSAWLWAKQAAHLYLGVATDATSALNTYLGFSDAHINMYADGKGNPSPGHEIDGATGHRFVGTETHFGTENHWGAASFLGGIAKGSGLRQGTNFCVASLNNSSMVVPNNAWTGIPFDTTGAQIADDGAMQSITGSAFVCPNTGLYAGIIIGQFANNATGSRGVRWLNTNSGFCIGIDFRPAIGSNEIRACFFLTFLTGGTVVQAQAYQNITSGTLGFGPAAVGAPCTAAVVQLA